jgi:iron complex outermembrane receptor protein
MGAIILQGQFAESGCRRDRKVANPARNLGLFCRLLCGGCTIALGVAQSAAAQTAPQGTTTVSEVVVTTQRREERLRDVPISVVAQTGDQLARAGVTNVRELSFMVPGVKIDQQGNYVQPAIRGISSGVVGPSTDAPVAIYVDGVVQPNQVTNHFDFADIDRVEVAKGPQGTLFGRNATGGAISIYTKAPSFTPTGSFKAGYGNFDNRLVQGYVSGPLAGDVLAASLSGFYNKHDGYSYDIARNVRTKGLDSKLVRGKLLFQPTDWAAITFIASYQDWFNSDAGDGVAPNRNSVANLDPTAIIATRPHEVSLDMPNFLKFKQVTATIRGELDIGELGKLTSISGYIRSTSHLSLDADRAFTPGPSGPFFAYSYPQPDITFSQELSFASRKFGPFSFVGGGYYYYDDNKFAANRVQTSKNPATDFWFNSWNPQLAYAGFFEGNYDVTDRLTLIAGLRYSWERRANKGSVGIGRPPPPQLIVGPVTRFHAWTPRVSVRYKVSDETNIYFTYSQGFKSGGIQSTGFLQPPANYNTVIYKPEKVKAYEVGLKTAPSPNLNFNVAGYYYDYTNLQVQVQVAQTAQTLNAATAEIYGLDADAVWRATPDLTFTAGLSLLHARYKRFPNAIVLANGTPTPGVGLTGPVAVVIDASGYHMPRAPDYAASLVADYTHPFEAGTLNVNVAVALTGPVYFDSNERVKQSAFALVNAQAFWQPRGAKWKVGAWVKNLTDEDYISSAFLQTTADIVGYGPPRTYGVEVDYSF